MLSGPSGVGKGTVVAALAQRAPSLWVSVSVTTRRPRPGEIEGVSYHFVDDARFDEMITAGEFLEHATYGAHRYGTPRRPVEEKLAARTPALLEIDLQGARQVRAAMPDAFTVFLAPPTWDELVRRLTHRGTEDPLVARSRLDRARIELAAEDEFDAVAHVWLESFESLGFPEAAKIEYSFLRERIPREIADGWEVYVADDGGTIAAMLANPTRYMAT